VTPPRPFPVSRLALISVLLAAATAAAAAEPAAGPEEPKAQESPEATTEPPPPPSEADTPEAAPVAPPASEGQEAGAPAGAPAPPPVPPTTQPPTPDEVFSGRPVPPTPDEVAKEHTWFDTSRSFVGRLFFAPIVRLDRFFSDEPDLAPERAESFARVRGGLRVSQDARPLPTLDILANVQLPGLNQWLGRFRFVLSGATEDTGVGFTADSSTTAAPVPSRPIDPTNLELRFGAFRGIESSLDLGAGALLRYPPGALVRLRYRAAAPIDDVLLARFSSQVFWRTDLHLGTRVTSALQWPITPSSRLRLGGAGQVAQRGTRGIEYGAELVYALAFTPTAAVAFGTDAQGASVDPVVFDKYRIYARGRHDVLRRWLFVELEPEVGWPWTPDRGRYRALAVTVRMEVQFVGPGPRPPSKPTEEPEAPDGGP